MTEKQWLSQVTELAQLLGWEWYHSWTAIHSPRGFPDLVLVRERVIFAELKSENGKVGAAQRAWIEKLQAANAESYIWRPSQFDEVMKILRRK